MSARDAVDVSIVTSGHDVADARLHREVAALRARGLSVEVLGLGDPTDGPAGAHVRTWPRRGMAARARLAVRLARIARGRVVMALDPDSGLAVCLVPGARCGGRHRHGRRRRIVVDVHEDYAALLGDRAWARRWGGAPGIAGRLLVRLGLATFRRADLVVVADEHVPPATARRRLVVRNLPDVSMLPPPGPRDAQPRAIYIGDLRASRGLFAMVEAVRREPRWHLDLVGPVAPADGARLSAVLAADSTLASRVHLHGRRPPAEAWGIGRGAWAGLLLLAPTPAFRDAVPSKLYEYLACGLPVIATDLPRSAELVRAAGAGAIVAPGADEVVGAAVADILRDWADHPGRLDALRDRLTAHAAQVTHARTPYDELADAILELAADVPSARQAVTEPTPARPPDIA